MHVSVAVMIFIMFTLQECILGLLDSKTVIYVKHQVEFLPVADLVLVSCSFIVRSICPGDSSSRSQNLIALSSALSTLDSIEAGAAAVGEDSSTGNAKNSLQKNESPTDQNDKTDNAMGTNGQLIQEEEREKGRAYYYSAVTVNNLSCGFNVP
ncbi:ABC transporter C family member 6 [Forsythia ovata]|uniref:ABC transporter C family member 6 n=1 Tax=Forsythia ovata TaxID=205694 RepID=A0ABD1WZV2_9LAMI